MATSPSATLTPKTPRVFRGVLYANLVYLLILAGALALQSAVGKPVIAAGLLLAVFLIFLPASIMIGAGVRAAYATRSGKILFLTITVLLSVLLAQDMIPDEALRLIAWCWIGVGQPVMLLGLMARVMSARKAARNSLLSTSTHIASSAIAPKATPTEQGGHACYASECLQKQLDDVYDKHVKFAHDWVLYEAGHSHTPPTL